MTATQKIQIRLSECRQRLNDLLGVETRSTEEQAELEKLTGEVGKLEPELRAAIAAEPDPVVTPTDPAADPEVRERLELRSRSSLGAFLLAAMQGRMVGGAEAEYAAAFNAKPGYIPLDLWERDRPAATAETRASTPAPSSGTGSTLAPILPHVFSPSIATRLGIEMPSVGSGGYSEATITTALPAAAREKGNDDDFTAAALTAVTASPRRISARMSITLEDIAAIGQGNFESALRENASMALSDEYDDQCINGNGTSPNVEGLVDQLTAATTQGTANTFALFLAEAAGAIDGLWATKLQEVAIVTNADAYKRSAQQFRANSSDLSFSDYARQAMAGWWCNSRMPATVSTKATGIVYRMGRPGLTTAVHPTWGQIGIDDIYSDSRSATRHFTLHALVGDKVLITQPDAYGLVEYKV